jgi:hypothetical protein
LKILKINAHIQNSPAGGSNINAIKYFRSVIVLPFNNVMASIMDNVPIQQALPSFNMVKLLRL